MDGLVAALAAGDHITYQKGTITQVANVFASMWRVGGLPSAAAVPPTGAGEAPTRATAGAIPGWTNSAGADVAYLGALSFASDDIGVFTLYDRLVHTSGLSGTSVAAQAIASAALTRYTDGQGVEAWLEVYTALGVTSRTATISYTNQSGTAGRTGTATVAASAAAGRMFPFALQAGDTGVRSVETLTLSGTTGTAGDFGITLLRRLADVPSGSAYLFAPRDAIELGLPIIQDDACLAFMAFTASTAVGPALMQANVIKG